MRKMRILKFTLITLAVVAVLLAAYYRFWFLRCPLREINTNEKVYISPANGLVASVTPWNDSIIEVLKGKYGVIDVWTNDVDTAGTMISIVMNVTNVHYQRAPQSGKIVSARYVEGKFNNAVANDNPFGIRFENEHNEMLFETQSGKRYKVIQIAGLLARRIVDFVETGEEKKKGDLIGLIKLGSQVTVILPSGVTPKVKEGQTILDGDVLAEEE
jgi:phosphatidylserine decarboxylase